MFPFGWLGVYQATLKAVEFAEVILGERTSEGATKYTKNKFLFRQLCNPNSDSYLTLQRSYQLQQ